jgi:SH3-like domain-containing protein
MQPLILLLNFELKIIILSLFFLILFTNNSLANNYEPKVAINGSGLQIPRMVSLKQSRVFMRSGPGLNYPIKFEFRKKKYPMKIIAEYYNWRQVVTYDNIKGWIATHLLSSVKTGLILKTTFLKISPSNQSLSKAKLLPQLLIEIKKCNTEWCKVIIVKNDKFDGWVKKEFIWGLTKNHIQ